MSFVATTLDDWVWIRCIAFKAILGTLHGRQNVLNILYLCLATEAIAVFTCFPVDFNFYTVSIILTARKNSPALTDLVASVSVVLQLPSTATFHRIFSIRILLDFPLISTNFPTRNSSYSWIPPDQRLLSTLAWLALFLWTSSSHRCSPVKQFKAIRTSIFKLFGAFARLWAT